MNGSIICGVDESESAKGAARVARALSSALGLSVVFVRAMDETDADADVTTAVAERLERLGAGADPADGGAVWSVEVGHPADALVAAAKKAQAALIVVGSTGPRSSLLGSVSAEVSRRAPCPSSWFLPGPTQTWRTAKTARARGTRFSSQVGSPASISGLSTANLEARVRRAATAGSGRA